MLLFLLVACGRDAETPPTVAPTVGLPPTAAAVRSTPTNLPATNTPLAENPAQPTATSIGADPAEPPVEIAPDPTNTLPPAEPEVVINGITEEGAFFRGRADAPVTFIDYSDFL